MESLANGILWVVDYGLLAILILLFYELFKFIFTFRKLTEPVTKLPERGVKGDWKQTVKDFRRLWWGAEKAAMREFAEEESLMDKLKAIEKALNKEPVNSEKVIDRAKSAKRDLEGRINRFTRRMEKRSGQLKELIDKKKLTKNSTDEFEIFRNDILARHDKIKYYLDKIINKEDMVESLQAAMKIEKQVLEDIEAMLVLEKKFEKEMKETENK